MINNCRSTVEWDNHVQNIHLGLYIVGYTVGNHVLLLRLHNAVKLSDNMPSQIKFLNTIIPKRGLELTRFNCNFQPPLPKRVSTDSSRVSESEDYSTHLQVDATPTAAAKTLKRTRRKNGSQIDLSMVSLYKTRMLA